MAVATVQCVCDTCGEKFEIRRKFKTRKEADNWEAYMDGKTDTCVSCWKKEKEDRDAKTAAKYNLPAIEGASEKQIAYAEKLRNKYVAEKTEKIDYYLKIIEKTKTEEYLDACEKANQDPKEYLDKFLKHKRLEHIAELMCEKQASAIIDMCKYN